jgi:hypothetical protein
MLATCRPSDVSRDVKRLDRSDYVVGRAANIVLHDHEVEAHMARDRLFPNHAGAGSVPSLIQSVRAAKETRAFLLHYLYD